MYAFIFFPFVSILFRDKIGNQDVTVAVTPNGYADAVTDGQFVLPEQRIMKMSQFLDILDNPSSCNGVFYIQKQNSNLTDEFQSIMKDVQPEITWASDAFSKFSSKFIASFHV